MSQLIIKGHATRGKEVTELLKMLGGNNPHEYVADSDCFGFFIGYETRNIYYDWLYNFEGKDVLIFTLEEFLERFPYKVGDTVQHKGATSCGSVYEVEKLRWKDNQVEYVVCISGNGSRLVFTPESLQPYQAETMDKAVFAANAQCCDIMNQLTNKETIEGKITINEDKGTLVAIDLTLDIKKANEIEVILGDYEFLLKDGKPYFVKKIKYPKTYEECCGALKIPNDERYIDIDVPLDYNKVLSAFTKLLICRQAYWKIAGEQMGLGKPLEPDWSNAAQRKYCIVNTEGNVLKWVQKTTNKILAFPTEEMRDTFYENFKDLIESCKEIL